MRQRIPLTIAFICLVLLTGLSCESNPSGPALEPPGSELLFDAAFNSIQMVGDFHGVDWAAEDTRNNMKLVDHFTWRIIASISTADIQSDGNIKFKFTHDNAWAPDNFGDGGTQGQAILDASPGDITLQMSGSRGFYTFELNDESLAYTTEPVVSAGQLSGSVGFAGEEPVDGATVALWAVHSAGDRELWDAEETRGDFNFAALADSVYKLRVTAGGYATYTSDPITVVDGEAAVQSITLSQVFGAISGRVSFSDDPDPLPEAVVVAYETGTVIEAGRDSTDALGDYKIEGLSSGGFDLKFSAPGYLVASLDGIEVDGDEEVTDQDLTLDPTSASTPDPPYFTVLVDGSIDTGWTALVDDPLGDSNWGATNDFEGFHVAWDLENLYMAVSGSFDSGGNTVNIYVDKDFGAGTGTVDLSTITGSSAGDHLRKTIDMSGVVGYGADFAGSVWSLQFDPEVTDISDAENIFAMEGQLLVPTSGAIEFSVPWTSIYPDMGGGVPPGAQMAVYCVIGGGGDEFLSAETLPAVADVMAPDAAIIIDLDTDGQ